MQLGRATCYPDGQLLAAHSPALLVLTCYNLTSHGLLGEGGGCRTFPLTRKVLRVDLLILKSRLFNRRKIRLVLSSYFMLTACKYLTSGTICPEEAITM